MNGRQERTGGAGNAGPGWDSRETGPGRVGVAGRLGVLLLAGAACLGGWGWPLAAGAAGLDLNSNGLGDVWEQWFNAGGMAPGGDTDGDGASTREESLAATDPRDPASVLAVGGVARDGGALVVSFPSVAGRRYTLEGSTDFLHWEVRGQPVDGDGGTRTLRDPAPDGHRFYRLACGEADADGDGISDWDEMRVGLDPTRAQTVPGTEDLVALTSVLGGGGMTVEIQAVDGQAWEQTVAGGAPEGGRLRITRRGGLQALSVALSVSGEARAGEDYSPAVPAVVGLPFGAGSVEVSVNPVADGRWEVPESVVVTVEPGEGYAAGASATGTVRIEDTDAAGETLYFAQLAPAAGATSGGSGYATAFLSADRTTLRATLQFSGLSAVQPVDDGSWLVHGPTGQVLYHLGSGGVVDDLWTFPAEGVAALSSAQALLDALVGGQVSVVVRSEAYPAGELRGDFRRTEGAMVFVAPAEPGPVPAYSGVDLDRDVARFVAQATFGATEGLLAEVKAKGIGAWIEEQMDPARTPVSNLRSYVMASDDWRVAAALKAGVSDTQTPLHQAVGHGWWLQSVHGVDQLRQRVAFALSEIFVVSLMNSGVRNRAYGAADFWDMLARNAFGNFRTLLEDVTLHPSMATYLSMLKNEKYNPATGVSPDENYAREVMQLFTIGLVELHPDGTLRIDPVTGQAAATYDNAGITELARVLTGWSFSKRQAGGLRSLSQWDNDGVVSENAQFSYAGGPPYAQAGFYHPLAMFGDRHDSGAKGLPGGRAVPAGQSGEKDLDDALDALFGHPNTPPFVARRLIQRLVTSNPDRGYVYRVARVFENDGQGVRGNLAAVVRAILTDHDARSQEVAGRTTFGKQREPLLRYTHLLRALRASSGSATQYYDTGTLVAHGYVVGGVPAGTRLLPFRSTSSTTSTLAQEPMMAPSVFNWFHPDFVYPGVLQGAGLVAPEFELTSETSVVALPNYLYSTLWGLGSSTNTPGPRLEGPAGGNPQALRLNLDLAQLQAAYSGGGSGALLEALDALFCSRQLGADARAAILEAVDAIPEVTEKIRTAVYLVLVSADYAIQR